MEKRRAGNVPGRYYVNENCIDCQLCADLAPGNFACNEEFEYHYVARQPQNEQELERVLDALNSCPTESICEDDKNYHATCSIIKTG